MKNTHIRTKALAIIFIVLVGYFLWKIIDAKKIDTNTQLTKSIPKKNLNHYQSKLLKFSVLLPDNFQINEKQTGVIFDLNNNSIVIARSATEFNNIEDHVKKLMRINKTALSNERKIEINHIEAISGIIKYDKNNSEKIIYLYLDGWIYDISTSSPELFDDLDAIAQTFQYTP